MSERPIRCQVQVEPEDDKPWQLRAAMLLGVAVLETHGRWIRRALAHVMTDAPGDCLYVPPGWLLDLDEKDREVARHWELVAGWLTHPDNGRGFAHAWLEREDLVLSVSNLKNGYPVYAMRRPVYYRKNGLQGTPARISSRKLRKAARQLGLGPELARWINGHLPKAAKGALVGKAIAPRVDSRVEQRP